MVGGLLLIYLSIYLSTYVLFYLMENIQTPGSFGFFLFFCTGISNILSDSLVLINIGLFCEFSPLWIRERRRNPFGAIAAKRHLIEVSNE